jgi:hypothetical protein
LLIDPKSCLESPTVAPFLAAETALFLDSLLFMSVVLASAG